MSKPPNRVAGRVAVVTGAERGIGRAIADRLSRDRAHLVVIHRTSVEDGVAFGRVDRSATGQLVDTGGHDEVVA